MHAVPSGCAATEDAFLDAVAEMLQRLAVSCQDALEWSSDSEMTVLRAAEAFQGVALVCGDAGIAVAAPTDFGDLWPFGDAQHSEYLLPNTGYPGSSLSSYLSRSASSSVDGLATSAGSATWGVRGSLENGGGSGAEDLPARLFRAASVCNDVVEIELTDLLVSTHEELQACKSELVEQIREVDLRAFDSHSQTQHKIAAMERALESSQAEMTRMQHELRSTQQRMDALHATVATSQQAVEATLKEQGRQWKAICTDLVVEKREVAKKLAEERGKCAALKEHMGMHAAGTGSGKKQSFGSLRSPDSRKPQAALKHSGSDVETAARCSSLHRVSSPLPASPAHRLTSNELLRGDSMSAEDGIRASSCAAAEPQSSSSITRCGQDSERNSSVSSGRRVKCTGYSTPSRGSLRERSDSLTKAGTRADNAALRLQLKLEPRAVAPTSNFRRYYLSSRRTTSPRRELSGPRSEDVEGGHEYEGPSSESVSMSSVRIDLA